LTKDGQHLAFLRALGICGNVEDDDHHGWSLCRFCSSSHVVNSQWQRVTHQFKNAAVATGLKAVFTLSVHHVVAQAFQGRFFWACCAHAPIKHFSTSPLQVRHFHVPIDSQKLLILRRILRTKYFSFNMCPPTRPCVY
jgi:hypothetical protein